MQKSFPGQMFDVDYKTIRKLKRLLLFKNRSIYLTIEDLD